MSYFTKIGNSISVKSKEIVNNAKAASETNSLTNIIKAEQQKIEANYRMIGKLYFQKFNKEPSEDFKEYIAAVKASIDKINEVNEEIVKIKNRNCCPKCGEKISSGSMFCSKCGTRVKEETPEINLPRCSNCGTVLKQGAVFCAGCGTKIQETGNKYDGEKVNSRVGSPQNISGRAEPSVNSSPNVNGRSEPSVNPFPNVNGRSEPSVNSSPNVNGRVEPSINSSPNVNSRVEPNVNSSPDTNVRVEQNTNSPQSAVNSADSNVSSSNANRFCSSCGAEQDEEEALFCIECGAKL